jgi:PAS domain S-box-containing protein
VFDTKQAIRENSVDPAVLHAVTYGALLPSRIIRHYLGVPLLLGDEVLGVIRVLNKKSKSYQPYAGSAELAAEGFSAEDLKLLSAIATQIASAIRNAHFVKEHARFNPIIEIDGSGRVQTFNRASQKLWGLDEKDVLGTHVEHLYKSPEHAREIGKAVWAAAKKGEGVQDYDAWVRRPDGEIIPIRLAAAGFFDKARRRVGSIGVFSDEREVHRQMEEKIRTSARSSPGSTCSG